MVMGLRSKYILVGIATSLVTASTASAFSYKMNAMCYLSDASGSQVQPFNPTAREIKESGSSFVRQTPTNVVGQDLNTKYRIASLSKILATHWAVAKLGPEYRFKTKVNITPTSQDKSCHVHFSGDQDIFLGKEMLATVFQQLKPILQKRNCARIAQLSYDEKFVLPFYGKSSFIMAHRDLADFRGSDPEQFYGMATTQKALTYFVRKFSTIKVKTIVPSSVANFNKYMESVPVTTYSFKSRPLYMMMREFNAYSSNVPPNILFEKLGGRAAHNLFIKNRLGYDYNEVDLHNGSGYPIVQNGEKIYNEVTCGAIVRTIQDLSHMLKAYKSPSGKAFQLADVMPVGGSKEEFSTFKSLYESDTFENTLVAKTGSAEKAITFGGMLNTVNGELFFAVLTEPSSYEPGYLSRPRTYIRDLVTILAERQKLKRFNYVQIGEMSPTDSQSTLVPESNIVMKPLN